MMKKLKSLGVVIAVALLFASCSASFTTANFKNLQMASEVDEATNQPLTKTDTFHADSPMIYLTGSIANAVVGSKIKAEWLYVEGTSPVDIDSTELELKEINTDFAFSLSKPDKGWPAGKYEVKLSIGDEYKQSVPFTVE